MIEKMSHVPLLEMSILLKCESMLSQVQSYLTTEMLLEMLFFSRKITLTVWSSVVTFRSSSCICKPTSLLYNTIIKIQLSTLIDERETACVYAYAPSWPGDVCPRCSETGAGWRWWYRSHWVSCGPGSPAWSALAELTSIGTQTGPCAPSLKSKEKNFSLGAHRQAVNIVQ